MNLKQNNTLNTEKSLFVEINLQEHNFAFNVQCGSKKAWFEKEFALSNKIFLSNVFVRFQFTFMGYHFSFILCFSVLKILTEKSFQIN